MYPLNKILFISFQNILVTKSKSILSNYKQFFFLRSQKTIIFTNHIFTQQIYMKNSYKTSKHTNKLYILHQGAKKKQF